MENTVCINLIKKIFNLKDDIKKGIDYDLSTDENKLFSFISQDFLKKYIFFTDLFSHYEEINGIEENYNEKKLKDIDFFLEQILRSKQGQIMEKYLNQNGIKYVKKHLFYIWFELYSSKDMNVKDTCGFEHVFIGEVHSKIGGYHNWIKYYLDEKSGIIDNYKLLLKSDNVVTIQYSINKIYKKIGGFFVGIDPITEFCVYTLSFLSRSNNLLIDLNKESFTIKNFKEVIFDSRIYPPVCVVKTVYPVIIYYEKNKNLDKENTVINLPVLIDLFNDIDKNLDGNIDKKEWGKNINKHLNILKKYFDVTTIEQVGKQFNLMDRNNNEVLSKNEMIKGFDLQKNRNIKIKKRIIHLLEKILN